MKLKILFIFTLLVLTMPGLSWSEVFQRETTPPSPEAAAQLDNYDTFNKIKSEIATQLQENQRLKSEQKALVEKLNFLKNSLDKASKEFQSYKPVAAKKAVEVPNPNLSLSEEVSLLQNEAMIKESKLSLLKGKLLDFQDQDRPWKLMRTDLLYQKRDLEMGQKLEIFNLEEEKRRKQNEIRELKDELKRTLEQEKDIYRLLSEVKEDASTYAFRIEHLQDENTKMEMELAEINKKKLIAQKELDLIKNKKMYMTQLGDNSVWKKEQEKHELELAVQTLDNQYKDLEGRITQSLTSREHKEELVKAMINIDKENQELRDKITALQNKIAALNQ